jgi:hypothetical protein
MNYDRFMWRRFIFLLFYWRRMRTCSTVFLLLKEHEVEEGDSRYGWEGAVDFCLKLRLRGIEHPLGPSTHQHKAEAPRTSWGSRCHRSLHLHIRLPATILMSRQKCRKSLEGVRLKPPAGLDLCSGIHNPAFHSLNEYARFQTLPRLAYFHDNCVEAGHA